MADFGYHDLEWAALGFALEDETWPVFVAWMRENHVTESSDAWLRSDPDLRELRLLWMAHSPDPAIAALSGILDCGPEEEGN